MNFNFKQTRSIIIIKEDLDKLPPDWLIACNESIVLVDDSIPIVTQNFPVRSSILRVTP